MSLHLNLSTGKFLNSSTLFKLSDALLLDLSSGEIVMSNLLVPRAGVDLFKLASLDLNFAQRKSLTDRVSGNNLVTFSRVSKATYVGSNGLIKTSPVNQWLNSEDVNAWSASQTTVVSDNALAPNGTQTADKVTFANITNNWTIRYQGAFTGTFTWSCWIKTADNTTKDIYLSWGSPSPSRIRTFTATGEWQRFEAVVTLSNHNLHLGNARDEHNITPQVWNGGEFYIWGAQLEEGTTATDYIPTGATISGAPRFDHDPVTGESLGLLIEEASANLIHYSEPDSGTPNVNATNGKWNFNNLDKNTEIDKVEGPDGVSNSASRMQLASGTQWDLYVRINNLTAGEKCTFSGWVRLGTATNFTIHVNDTVAWDTVADGVYSFEASDGLNTTSFVKISHTFTAPVGGNVNVHIGRHQGTAPAQQTTGTVDVWGLQIERKSFATSTIQTSGSIVTRAADVASITGTNFSSWYNQSEGTIFTDASASGASGVVGFNDGSTDRWRVGFAGDNNAKAAVIVGGVVQTNISTPANSTPYNQYHKLCIAIAENNLVFAYNGNALSDNSLSVPSVAGMTIGSAIGVPGRINGHVKRLAYFPTPKTEQESIGLTT